LGEKPALEYVLANLDRLVIKPAYPNQRFEPMFGRDYAGRERDALIARIRNRPYAYVAQEHVRLSQAPVWKSAASSELAARALTIRVYAVTTPDGVRVMPGGLARVAHEGAADVVSTQRGGGAKDIWVLSDGAHDETLTSAPGRLPAQRHDYIPSRLVENLYWLGRYTERADNSVRLARITLEGLSNGNPVLLDALGRLALRNGLVGAGVPSPTQSVRLFERSLVHTLLDPQATSVAYDLRALRRCAQALRERLSQEHWQLIDAVGRDFEERLRPILQPGATGHGVEPVSDVLAVLQRTATHLAAITGAQSDRMTRDDGWRLLSIGRQVERLDFLSQTLALGVELDLPAMDDGFALLLALFDSTITYRAQFQARRELPPLLHLLVLDPDNPRSLAGVAHTLRDRVTRLARHEQKWVQRVLLEMPTPDEWSLEALCAVDDQGQHAALVASLHNLGERTQALSAEVGRRLFSHVGSVDHTVWQ